MSQIKGKDTKPELLVRKFLHKKGYRYRLHKKNLPGKPDLVLKKYRTVIFVHGCFFHVHECKVFKWPTENREFWVNKLRGNAARDKQAIIDLKKAGWTIITLWECQLKPKTRDKTLEKLLKLLPK